MRESVMLTGLPFVIPLHAIDTSELDRQRVTNAHKNLPGHIVDPETTESKILDTLKKRGVLREVI